jgi:hypothetical protein
VSDAKGEIGIANSNAPTSAAEAEIELTPHCETAQGDSGQPCSATDLLSFPHCTPSVFKEVVPTVPTVQPLRLVQIVTEKEPTIQHRECAMRCHRE